MPQKSVTVYVVDDDESIRRALKWLLRSNGYHVLTFESAEDRVERSVPFRMSADETLDIWEDTGTPVSEDYLVPFKFTGNLKRVLIGLTDTKLTAEDEEEIRRAKAAIGMSR